MVLIYGMHPAHFPGYPQRRWQRPLSLCPSKYKNQKRVICFPNLKNPHTASCIGIITWTSKWKHVKSFHHETHRARALIWALVYRPHLSAVLTDSMCIWLAQRVIALPETITQAQTPALQQRPIYNAPSAKEIESLSQRLSEPKKCSAKLQTQLKFWRNYRVFRTIRLPAVATLLLPPVTPLHHPYPQRAR